MFLECDLRHSESEEEELKDWSVMLVLSLRKMLLQVFL